MNDALLKFAANAYLRNGTRVQLPYISLHNLGYNSITQAKNAIKDLRTKTQAHTNAKKEQAAYNRLPFSQRSTEGQTAIFNKKETTRKDLELAQSSFASKDIADSTFRVDYMPGMAQDVGGHFHDAYLGGRKARIVDNAIRKAEGKVPLSYDIARDTDLYVRQTTHKGSQNSFGVPDFFMLDGIKAAQPKHKISEYEENRHIGAYRGGRSEDLFRQVLDENIPQSLQEARNANMLISKKTNPKFKGQYKLNVDPARQVINVPLLSNDTVNAINAKYKLQLAKFKQLGTNRMKDKDEKLTSNPFAKLQSLL